MNCHLLQIFRSALRMVGLGVLGELTIKIKASLQVSRFRLSLSILQKSTCPEECKS